MAVDRRNRDDAPRPRQLRRQVVYLPLGDDGIALSGYENNWCVDARRVDAMEITRQRQSEKTRRPPRARKLFALVMQIIVDRKARGFFGDICRPIRKSLVEFFGSAIGR